MASQASSLNSVRTHTPHCLNRALAIDFRITHFRSFFLKEMKRGKNAKGREH